MKRTSKRWSPEEIEQLKENGFVPGRSENAITHMKKNLGIKVERTFRPNWEKRNVDKLRELAQKGLSAKKIHEMGVLSCSVNAIQKQICRLGLAKRNKILKFSSSTKLKFRKFLAEKWEGKTP